MITKTIKIIVLIWTVSSLNFLHAQDDFEKWLKKDSEDFNKFLSEEDKQFLSFLKDNWSRFNLNEANKQDVKPKPDVLPIYKPDPAKSDPLEKLENPPKKKETPPPPVIETPKPVEDKTPAPVIETPKPVEDKTPNPVVDKPPPLPVIETPKQLNEIKDEPVEKEKPETVIPKVEKPVPAPIKNVLKIKYFGEELVLPKFRELEPITEGKISNELISNHWVKLSNSGYTDVVTRAVEIKHDLLLNDWGYYLLLGKIAEAVLPREDNSQNLLVWFLLNKSGYKARIVRTDDSIILAIPSKSMFYGIPFINGAQENEKAYLFAGNSNKTIPKSFYSYQKDHPEATKYVELNIQKAPLFTSLPRHKQLQFSYLGTQYNVETDYDEGLVEYFEDYPITDLATYFNAAISPKIEASLVKNLREIIKDKSEPVAANMILRFVQTAFDYKTDQQNFGREKPLFREETVHYKYSDCEDRSILFSFLVKELLGLKVVGLDYPGHVCTAVKFNAEVQGDYISYKNQNYLICDPTYIGAYIGMCMPDYKNKSVERIIELN